MAQNVGTVHIHVDMDEFSAAFYGLLAACKIVLEQATWDATPQSALINRKDDVRLAVECAIAMAEAALTNAEAAKQNYAHPLLKNVRKNAEERMR